MTQAVPAEQGRRPAERGRRPAERGLLDAALRPLPLGAIRPAGWLKDQLRVQAEGLSGHLDEFWPDIADSGWFGGEAEGWERAPYWLDGLVPLAYQLGDEALVAKAARYMDYIIAHQADDGWLGPTKCRSGKYRPYDPWPVFVALKALVQYYEASGDERVPGVIERFLRRLDHLLDEQPLFDWGKSRWADLVWTIHRLYDCFRDEGGSGDESGGRDGDGFGSGNGNGTWLLELAAKVRAQGFDWAGWFRSTPITTRIRRGEHSQISHVVNNAMAVKAPGVWYRQSAAPADRQDVYLMLDLLDRYHGQVTGVFTGDEHLAGRNPSQGTELCAVVEFMFSLEVLLSCLGDPQLADRLEKIAFNALPATFTTDMWAHQYDQQVNQICCRIGRHIWTTNGPDANIFGLEPNYGCCTANMHQGWPKLTAHLWYMTPEGGLAAVVYAPSMVRCEIGGVHVEVREETNYPFAGTVRLHLESEAPVAFPLRLRVPAWAEEVKIKVNGKDSGVAALPGTFAVICRTWRKGDTVDLELPLVVRCEAGYNGAAALLRGPLVFSLPIAAETKIIKEHYGRARDMEFYPTAPWGYGLDLALDLAQGRILSPEKVEVVESGSISPRPFDPVQPPVILRVPGRRLPDWRAAADETGEYLDASPPPAPPLAGPPGPPVTLELIPYGATCLRITELPVLG